MARHKEENYNKPQMELRITEPESEYGVFLRQKKLQCSHEVYLHARKRGFKSQAPSMAV
jgi:hypothetical protein